MDQNNGLEAKIFNEGTRVTLTMDSGEIPQLLIKISSSHMRATVPLMEDQTSNAQIGHSIEAMKSISKWVFEQSERELAKLWKFLPFSMDSKERHLTKDFLPPTRK